MVSQIRPQVGAEGPDIGQVTPINQFRSINKMIAVVIGNFNSFGKVVQPHLKDREVGWPGGDHF